MKVAALARGAIAAAIMALAAQQALAEPTSVQSKSCVSRADQKGFKGAERTHFLKACMKGAMTPAKPTQLDNRSAGSKAITSPSGVDRTVRSSQCSAEADKRGYKESTRDAFRKACLASAAPVDAIGVQTRQTAPTHAKDSLELATPPSSPHQP